jgi:hypothetical protein
MAGIGKNRAGVGSWRGWNGKPILTNYLPPKTLVDSWGQGAGKPQRVGEVFPTTCKSSLLGSRLKERRHFRKRLAQEGDSWRLARARVPPWWHTHCFLGG